MKKRFLYLRYYLKHLHHKFRAKRGGMYSIMHTKFLGKMPPSDEEANHLIKEMITSGRPFALCRLGSAEFTLMQLFDEYQLFHHDRLHQSNMYTLFHKDMDEISRWVNLTKEDCRDVDIMAYFEDHPMEEYLIRSYCQNSRLIRLEQIETILYDVPWTMALEGKKVLVISPFVDTIREQYPKIDKIYEGMKMLPSFELKTLKSVWFSGDREDDDFDTWFDALQYLYDEAMKIDFDIALLSCSTFGFDLACMFKRAGKQAIQYGGALQVLFGIKGARWDNYPPYSKYYNEYWVRAPKTEAPSKRFANKLDNGCYW